MRSKISSKLIYARYGRYSDRAYYWACALIRKWVGDSLRKTAV